MREWQNLKDRRRLKLKDSSYLIFSGPLRSCRVSLFRQSGYVMRSFILATNLAMTLLVLGAVVLVAVNMITRSEEFAYLNNLFIYYFLHFLFLATQTVSAYVHLTSFLWILVNFRTKRTAYPTMAEYKFLLKAVLLAILIPTLLVLLAAIYVPVENMPGGNLNFVFILLALAITCIVGMILLSRKSKKVKQ